VKKTKEIYLMHSEEIGAYKVGISKNPNKRLNELKTGCPYPIKIIYNFPSKRPFLLEAALHKSYCSYKKNLDGDSLFGEWFNLPPSEVSGFIDKCKKIEDTMDFLAESGNPFI
jgi:hypothetical protein